jgi:hypothetical protein
MELGTNRNGAVRVALTRWAIYALASALLVGACSLLAGPWFEPAVRRAIWVAVAVAWVVQAVAFAVLCAVTARRARLVLVGWTAGSLLRLAALALVAWLSLAGIWSLPAAPTLLALVIALFALLLLEPVFFRQRTSTS